MKKIACITTLFFITPLYFVQAYTFTRTLSVGSTGQDVFELQKILNSDTRTEVATTGTGSMGNESTYFGQKTKDAVARFQDLYAEQILYPNNLTRGTGIVGPSTLSFLNTYVTYSFSTTTSTQTDTRVTPTTSNTATTPVIPETPSFFVSKTMIRPKEVIYVGSQQKLTDLDFYVDSYKMNKSCRHSEYACAFRVRLNSGTYTLRTSDPKLGSYTLTILDKNAPIPETSITKLSLSKNNIITGENFTNTIKIFTLFGMFESETVNDSFSLKFPQDYVRYATTTTEGLFFLQNDNGLQSDPRIIQYEL